MRPTPSAYSLESVLAKWVAAIRGIRNAKNMIGQGGSDKVVENINAAGQNLSSVIEFAIKLHIQNNWTTVESRLDSLSDDQRKKNDFYNTFNLPGAIRFLYKRNKKKQFLFKKGLSGVAYDVDFNYLATNRDCFANNTSHKAIDLVLSDVEKALDEIRKYVNNYITSDRLPSPESLDINEGEVVNFYEQLDGFQEPNTIYILVNDFSSQAFHVFPTVTRVDWSAVIDFDNNTFDKGNLGDTYGQQNLRRLLKCGDITQSTSLVNHKWNPIYFLADGFDKVIPPSSDVNQWKRSRLKYLDKFIELLFRDIVVGGYQKMVILSLNSSIVVNNSVLSLIEIKGFSLAKIEYYVFDKRLKSWVENSGNNNLIYLPFSLASLNEVLMNQLPIQEIKTENYNLPYRKEDEHAKGTIPIDRVRYFSDYLDILYKRNNFEDKSPEEKKKYYLGQSVLPWAGVFHHWAVERSFIDNLKKQIESWVNNFPYEGPKVCRLLHYPGDGGTTLSRQVALSIHKDYPTVFITRYSLSKVSSLLEELYDYVRLPIIVFVEVPEVMLSSELEQLACSINNTKRIILIGISRKSTLESGKRNVQLCPDWGEDFKEVKKLFINLNIIYGYGANSETLEKNIDCYCNSRYKTPFEVALTVFNKDFKGITPFVRNFYLEYDKDYAIRSTLGILALLDMYGHTWISESPFRFFFKIPNDQMFSLKEKLPIELREALLKTRIIANLVQYGVRHNLLSREILRQFWGMKEEDDSYKNNLFRLLGLFIEMAASVNDETYEKKVTELCIERDPESENEYAAPVSILDDDKKILLFKSLVEYFPYTPHYHAHLARALVKLRKDFSEGIKHIDKAIELGSENDYVLYHIRGECFRNMLNQRISVYDKTGVDSEVIEGWSFEKMIAEGCRCYKLSRENQQSNNLSTYGYDGEILLLLKALEYVKKLSKDDTWKVILNKSPYSAWYEDASNLIEELRTIGLTYEEFKEAYDSHIVRLQKILNNYSKAIEYLQNQLQQNSSDNIRRLLVGCYLSRPIKGKDRDYRMDTNLNSQLRKWMEENLSSSSPNQGDFNRWLELSRYSNATIVECAGVVNEWAARTNHPVITFYSYALQIKLALNDSILAVQEAADLLKKCQALRNGNTLVREWIGMEKIRMRNCLLNVYNDSLESRMVFEGVVNKYSNGGSAEITLIPIDISQRIIFVPKREHLDESCLNKRVNFYLGVSYDGLRAENVKLIEDI
ncbi:MAG: hypothetical protein HDQ88_06390 [Clostridia bacterium]|nr:hypothetical protein [Clostridia bacterium]